MPIARINPEWRKRLGLVGDDLVFTGELADRVNLIGPLEQERRQRR